ncbi:MAG: hypothetical protein V3T88_04230, partial [Nitrosomonadaceae bacterium]
GTEDRVYRFSIPFRASLSEAYNAACNVANDIAQKFNEAVKKQQEEKKESEGSKESEKTKEEEK